jgi:hypothetical protein
MDSKLEAIARFLQAFEETWNRLPEALRDEILGSYEETPAGCSR